MKKSVSIIGGGPSALLLASLLNSTQFEVTIYEKNKTLGRKFLVAGKGGFNLTHSEPIPELIARYIPPHFLEKALLEFDNIASRNWLKAIGIPTFIGTSKRVYPALGIKPIAVLNAIVSTLGTQGVFIKYQHTWTGWNNNNQLTFNSDTVITSDYNVFALGGSSWKITDSDGHWLDLFGNKNIPISPFQSSNCGYLVDWTLDFIATFEGTPMKNITLTCSNAIQKGEVIITRFGLEGSPVYALSPQIRNEIQKHQKAILFMDFKTTLNYAALLQKIKNLLTKRPAKHC